MAHANLCRVLLSKVNILTDLASEVVVRIKMTSRIRASSPAASKLLLEKWGSCLKTPYIGIIQAVSAP
jgi:hypothetical protein